MSTTNNEVMILLNNLCDDMAEVRDRARRTETRLTRYIQSQGVDTGAMRPRFDPVTGTVHMPSPDSTVRDVIACVPPLMRASTTTVNLMVGGDLYGTLHLPPL